MSKVRAVFYSLFLPVVQLADFFVAFIVAYNLTIYVTIQQFGITIIVLCNLIYFNNGPRSKHRNFLGMKVYFNLQFWRFTVQDWVFPVSVVSAEADRMHVERESYGEPGSREKQEAHSAYI